MGGVPELVTLLLIFWRWFAYIVTENLLDFLIIRANIVFLCGRYNTEIILVLRSELPAFAAASILRSRTTAKDESAE